MQNKGKRKGFLLCGWWTAKRQSFDWSWAVEQIYTWFENCSSVTNRNFCISRYFDGLQSNEGVETAIDGGVNALHFNNSLPLFDWHAFFSVRIIVNSNGSNKRYLEWVGTSFFIMEGGEGIELNLAYKEDHENKVIHITAETGNVKSAKIELSLTRSIALIGDHWGSLQHLPSCKNLSLN